MTKFHKLLLSVAGASLLVASCTKQEDSFVPGEQDVANCQGVYFPAQEVGGAFEPSTSNYPLTITVARTDDSTANGSITVPVVISGTGAEYLTLPEIVFEPGQKEVVLNGSISSAVEAGTEFDVMISINDNQYASLYSSKPSYLSFSFIVEKWNLLGEGQFMDLWIGSGSFPVQIYQNDGDNNRYRIIDPYKGLWEYWGSAYTAGGWQLSTPADKIDFTVLEAGVSIHEGDADFETKVSEGGYVYYSPIKMGLYNLYYSSDVYSYHPSDIASSAGNESNLAWNKVFGWQENGLPSAVYMAGSRYMPGIGGWGGYDSGDEAIIVIFPGGALTDYTIEIEAGVTEEGKLPITFSTGGDVNNVKYAIYEGELTAGEVVAKTTTIGNGTEEGVSEFAPEASGITEVSVELGATGIYTIVAVSFDEKGQSQESGSISFGYVAAGDEESVAVMAGCSLENITDNYVFAGYDATTSLLATMYSIEATSASYGLVKKSTYDNDPEAVWEGLTSIGDSVLSLMNSTGGQSFVISGLQPSTEYVLLLQVGNGYSIKNYTAAAKTLGLDPVLQSSGIYNACAFYEAETEGVPFYFDANTENEYYFDGYLDGEGILYITQDQETSKVEIPIQSIGISNSYGTHYVGEVMDMINYLYEDNAESAIAYYENYGMPITSIAGMSGWSENGDTLYLAMFYYTTAGYVGTGLETYVPQASEEAPMRLVSTREINLVKADFAPVKADAFSNLAPQVKVIANAELNRVVKATAYDVLSVKSVAREEKNHQNMELSTLDM